MTLMAIALTGLSWLLVAPIILLFAIYVVEVAVGVFGAHKPSAHKPAGSDARKASSQPKTVILIPAHNEASIISQNISALIPTIPRDTRILVVADNCSDDTAALARAAGADVMERSDQVHRGKGYALAFGRDSLAADPPDCVIVLDADCMLEKDSAAGLAAAAVGQSVPVQATNLIHSAAAAPPVVQISNFAMLMKNLVRQRGMTRLGGAALLTGTGMAFPWTIFATAPLASGDLAEDLALGVSMAKQGHVTHFLESAKVSSEAAAAEDTLVQRTRWEHGFLTTARLHALPLIGSGLKALSRAQFFLGLHLLVPPLALLFAIGVGVSMAVALLTFVAASPLPLIILLTILAAAIIVTMVAWLLRGHQVLTAGALIRIPLYILWKIPVYLKLFKGSETRWIRTRRPGEGKTSD